MERKKNKRDITDVPLSSGILWTLMSMWIIVRVRRLDRVYILAYLQEWQFCKCYKGHQASLSGFHPRAHSRMQKHYNLMK